MADERVAQVCGRAREWSSLRLDGELSDFEGALLDAHLARCAGCRDVSRAMSAITDRLRETALEPLALAVVLPRRRRLVQNHVLLTAAAAVVVTTSGIATALTLGGASRELPGVAPAEISPGRNSDLTALRALRRAQLRPSAHNGLGSRPRNLQIG